MCIRDPSFYTDESGSSGSRRVIELWNAKYSSVDPFYALLRTSRRPQCCLVPAQYVVFSVFYT